MKNKLEKGVFLIAEPFLNDPNFERSVIYLCDHSNSGSIGFVVNQETNLTLADVLDEPFSKDIPLYLGGPVEKNTLHFLHQWPDLISGSMNVGNGVYWGGNFEEAKGQLNTVDDFEKGIRFFIGYSGWSEGQLDEEMSHDTWIISPGDAPFLFGTPARAFWREVLKKMGGKYKSIAHYPVDPSLN